MNVFFGNNPVVSRFISGCLYGLAFSLPLSIAVSSVFYFSLLGVYLLAGVWAFRLWPPPWGAMEKGFVAFWGVSVLSGILGVSPRHSLPSLGNDLYFLLVILLGALLTTELRRKRTFQFFMAGAILAAFWGVVQYVVGVDQSDSAGGVFLRLPRALEGWPRPLLDELSLNHGRVAGTRSHPLTYAEGLLIPLAYSMSRVMLSNGRFWRGAVGSWLLGASIVLSKSRGPWLAVIAMAVLFPLFVPFRTATRRGWVLLLPLALVFLLPGLRSRAESIANPRHSDNVERLRMWKAGWQMVKDHPFLGIGPGNMERVSPSYQGDADRAGGAWGHLHNTFIHMAAERGLPALGVFGWLLVLLARTFVRAGRGAFLSDEAVPMAAVTGLLALAGFVVSGLTETNYNDAEILMTFYFAMGVFLSWTRKPRPEPSHASPD